MKQIVLFLAFVSVVVAVPAQVASGSGGESSFGVVVYAEGEQVLLVRDGRRFEYDAFTGELLGFPIFPGDTIQTDPETYVEIQLLPSRSLIKVAENTSFTVSGVSPTGDGILQLGYGRLRARVSRLTGGGPFEVRMPGATAGVRGTDFGADLIVESASAGPVTRIYCFEGEVQVEFETEAQSEPVSVEANQMVTKRRSFGDESDTQVVPQVVGIDPGVSGFWQSRDFVAEPRDAGELLAEYPFLREDALARLGSVEFISAATSLGQESEPESLTASDSESRTETAPEVSEPADAALPTTDEPSADVAVSLEGGDSEFDPERRERLVNATKATGITMLGLGLVADAAAVTFYFAGDRLLPSWPPATDTNTILAVGAAGGVLIIGGVLTLLLGVQMGQ